MKDLVPILLAVLCLGSVFGASNLEKCRAVTSCNRGSASSPACTRSSSDTEWNCPACVDFAQNPILCYEECVFSTVVDCKALLANASSSATTSPISTTSTPSSTSSSTNSTSKSKNSGSGSHNDAGNAGDDGKTNSKALYFIIGGVCIVVAVAVIFIVLVRRTHSPDDDIEEMEVPPPSLTKTRGSSAQLRGSEYMQYGPSSLRPSLSQQQLAANPTTPTNRVIQYYQENAMPSPRVAPTAFVVPKVVRPVPTANAPTFFASSYNAAPIDDLTVSTAYQPAPNAVHVGASEYSTTTVSPTEADDSSIATHLQQPATEYPPQQERHDSFEF